MKKLVFYCLLIGGAMVLNMEARAQFRSLPAAVTDSFKVRYPNAQQVSWTDKFNAFQANFMQDTTLYTARFKATGEFQWATKRIAQASLPAAVADGFSKSKYADPEWKVGSVVVHYLPGGVIQYTISIAKSGLQKKNLLFSSTGQLIKDDATL
ncbi:MAG TPA: hypothetical protein VG052_15825 [Puia sp.]|jgi:hypothetical protein|nr:hypothetical protein [Puia sp.]